MFQTTFSMIFIISLPLFFFFFFHIFWLYDKEIDLISVFFCLAFLYFQCNLIFQQSTQNAIFIQGTQFQTYIISLYFAFFSFLPDLPTD